MKALVQLVLAMGLFFGLLIGSATLFYRLHSEPDYLGKLQLNAQKNSARVSQTMKAHWQSLTGRVASLFSPSSASQATASKASVQAGTSPQRLPASEQARSTTATAATRQMRQGKQTTPAPRAFTLELATHLKLSKAQQLTATLKKHGINAYFIPFEANGKDVFAVRYGVYPKKDEAMRDSKTLGKQTGLNIRLIALR